MACSAKILLVLLTLVVAAPAQAASRAQFRYLSFVVRDQAPTTSEAKAFRAGETTIEGLLDQWLASPAHVTRVQRYFRDMFGVADDVMPIDWSFGLYANQDTGQLYRKRKNDVGCALSVAVDSEAWWLEPGETIKVCPRELSETLTYTDDEGRELPCTADQTTMKTCGCGPRLIGCLPETLGDDLKRQIREEFAARAASAYGKGESWYEAFAGDRFFGTRLLYWKYLQATKMARGGSLPTAAELATLASLSMNDSRDAEFPEGAPRAGLVTSPGFLQQYNNYRTRIRALSEKLLCQNVGAPLNTSGIAVYLNPDFKPEDLSHADHEQCARCHFPMDNLGSMLFGFNQIGEWDPLGRELSRIGHAFGQDGEGPRFLIRSFIERGPGFVECMARTAWEDFAGSRWEELTETDRQGLLALAARGPKDLIQTMLRSTLLANLGIDSTSAEAPKIVSTVPWEEVQPLVAKSCDGGTCHSNGSFNTTYVDNQKNLLDHAVSVVLRIKATDAKQMPPPTSGKALSDDDRAKFLGFLGQ